jgi:hypothetical protein
VRESTARAKRKLFDYHLRYTFGIDAEDWARLFNAQNQNCAVCLRRLLGDKSTHVDHCHATGKVRGLLCLDCNTSIGRFGDDPNILLRAVAYLNRGTDHA